MERLKLAPTFKRPVNTKFEVIVNLIANLIVFSIFLTLVIFLIIQILCEL